MAYTPKQIETTFNDILQDIEHGYSLRTVLKNGDNPSSQTFYKWLDGDEDKSKRYTRACEARADEIFEDILDIADDSSGDSKELEDGKKVFDGEFAARSRIKIDARKWMLGKMNPKKYSDKINLKVEDDRDKTIEVKIIE